MSPSFPAFEKEEETTFDHGLRVVRGAKLVMGWALRAKAPPFKSPYRKPSIGDVIQGDEGYIASRTSS